MAFTKLEPGDYPGIGGSDISSILGLSKYRTAFDFWEENKGVRERFNGNLPTNIGLSTEQLNMSVYQKRTHNIVYYYQSEIDDWFGVALMESYATTKKISSLYLKLRAASPSEH